MSFNIYMFHNDCIDLSQYMNVQISTVYENGSSTQGIGPGSPCSVI